MWIDNPENEVEEFINKFMMQDNEDDCEVLHKKFRAGYCYYFAHILKIAFDRGLVCWTAPFGHFVWVDADCRSSELTVTKALECNAYDIEGRYYMDTNECFYLVPECYIGSLRYDFLHSKVSKPASRDDIIGAIKLYCLDTGEQYISEIEEFLSRS